MLGEPRLVRARELHAAFSGRQAERLQLSIARLLERRELVGQLRFLFEDGGQRLDRRYSGERFLFIDQQRRNRFERRMFFGHGIEQGVFHRIRQNSRVSARLSDSPCNTAVLERPQPPDD